LDTALNSFTESLGLLQRGKPEEAVALQSRLQLEAPDRGEFFFAQAFVLLCERDDVALAQIVAQALARHCEPYFTHIFQALRCHLENQHDQALALGVEAHRLKPELPFALIIAARVQTRQDKYTEAFHNFSKSFLTIDAPLPLRIERLRCLEMIEATRYSSPLAQGAIEYLEQPLLNYTRIARLVSSLIVKELKLDSGADNYNIDAALDSRLLLASTDQMIFQDPHLERFLVMVRQYLLTQLYQRFDMSDLLVVLATKLAEQCFYNEYVYDEVADETTLVEELAVLVETALTTDGPLPAQFPGQLLAVALYRPLHSINGIEQLTVDPQHPLAKLLEVTVRGPRSEQELARSIPTLGSISDGVSLRVKQQYEQNPYPRWISFDQLVLRKSYFSALETELHSQGIALPQFRFPNANAPTRILVAGCGTGQHAISIAKRYEHAVVTAVDISMSSLAYAKYMAQRYGISNIEFLQCDILSIGELGQTFDVIESVGTLHHMDSPDAGLRALTHILAPGGVMRIGLYSQLARRQINAIRSQHAAELVANFNTSKLRQMRHQLIEQQANDPVLGIADFYSASGCRDLLCHVHEHQYTIDGLKNLLASCALRFVGFNFQSDRNEGRQLFRQLFGSAKPMDNLDCWADVEAQLPELFAEMYIFYARKV
jgi:ubiquinone/menaquinone biosynthesis C-methylase UbiE